MLSPLSRYLRPHQPLLRQARPLSTSVPVFRPVPSSSRLAEAATAASPSATPPTLTDGEKALKDKLEQSLQGARIEVQDVSGGCGTFYAISIAHSSFKGLSTIKQHRLVNELLKEDIKGMHGLQLQTKAE